MKQAYFIAGCGLAIPGVVHLMAGLSGPGFLLGVQAFFGLSLVLTASIHLLNWRYGSGARGLRGVAIGASIALTLLMFPFTSGMPGAWFDWLLFVLLPTVTILAFFRGSLRPLDNAPM